MDEINKLFDIAPVVMERTVVLTEGFDINL